MKWLVTTICFCLLTFAMTNTAAAQGSSSAWQGTVKLEEVALYSGLSVSSPVVTMLRRGDSVDIKLEINGEGGTWYAVTAPGQSGYLRAQALELGQPEVVAQWEYNPPPEPSKLSETESADAGKKPIAAASRAKFESDVKSFFVSKFGRTLPVSAFGQTSLHSHLGFDHRNAVDVALNPDSAEGRALLGKLRGFGIPFIAFRQAIPGIATGAHIHIGKPSPKDKPVRRTSKQR